MRHPELPYAGLGIHERLVISLKFALCKAPRRPGDAAFPVLADTSGVVQTTRHLCEQHHAVRAALPRLDTQCRCAFGHVHIDDAMTWPRHIAGHRRRVPFALYQRLGDIDRAHHAVRNEIQVRIEQIENRAIGTRFADADLHRNLRWHIERQSHLAKIGDECPVVVAFPLQPIRDRR